MKKALLFLCLFIVGFAFGQAPANDNCTTPQIITIPASGNICINSSNINATTDLLLFACQNAIDDDVWFTFIATGTQNTITITPNGGTPAQQVAFSMSNTNCASGAINVCNASATNGGAATATYSYTPGTQVLVNVTTNGSDGTFQLCITSTTPPPAPGSSCATATTLCDQTNFTVNPMPSNVSALLPSCFFVNLQQPVFYQFTVGVTGTCAWLASPLGLAEYDWAMYDITAGCPGAEVACNYDYGGGNGFPIGMQPGSPSICPTSAFYVLPGDEICPSITVTAGQTYLIVIDNFDASSIGFDFSWAGSTFQMSSSAFTVAPANACNSAVATFVNNSVPVAAASSWNFGDGTTSALHSPPPHNYPTPGTYLISLTTTTANGCVNVSSGSVTVNATPTMTTPANITVCAGSNIPASAFVSNPTGATFAWTNSNAAIGLAANGAGNTPAFVAVNGTGANIVATITVTPTENGCAGTPVNYTITVQPAPTVANAGPNQNVCVATATMAGNVAASGVGTWTLISGTGTITTPNSPTTGITGLGAGANVFQWTITSGACPATTSQVTITVGGAATVAAAGAPQTVCGTVATLAGNVAAIGTGTWTLVSGAGTITTPTLNNSGVTGLGVGANVFQWTITNPPCAPTSSQVTITGVATPTVANAGGNQNVCGTVANLGANTAVAGTGTWTLVSGAGVITNPALFNSGVTGLGAGANVFQWTIANAPCPASTSQVTITSGLPPTVANAGPNQTVCGTTATLAGNLAAVGTGTWTLISGAGVITNPALNTSGVTGLGVGANVFQWTITNAPCPASFSQVTITGVAVPTVANAGAPQTVCGTVATLAGNAAGTGTWTLVSGAGVITNPALFNSGVTGLGAGANVFQWEIDNLPCAPTTSQVTITSVLPPTVAAAGGNQNICGTTATLAGNTATTGTGLWTLISGSGTVTTPSLATSGITGLTVGANVFQWTISNAPCPATTSQTTITVGLIPTVANAGTNQTVCGTTATLAGNQATNGVGTWTLISGAGTITNPNSETSGITGLGAGANVFQWEIDLLPCPPTTSQVTITSVAVPTVAAAGPNQTVCGTSATLAGNPALVGTGTWTLVSGSGTITTPTLETSGITGLGVGANVFQWEIDNAPCPPSTSQVTITGVAVPTVAAAGANQTVCGITATLAGNTATVGTGAWTVISGTGTVTNPALGTSGITALGAGANVFQWTITNGICPSTSSQVTITSVTPPTVSVAGPNQTVCTTTATLAGNAAASGTGTWTLVSGGGTITNPALPTSGLTSLVAGTDVFQWTIANAPCPATSSQVTITVGTPPTIAVAGPNQTICGTTATLAGNTAIVGTGVWTLISGSGTITNLASATSGLTALAAGANVFQWTITNAPCPASTSQVTITANPIPPAPVVITPLSFCLNDFTTPLTATGINLLWYTTAVGGVGNPVAPTPSTLAPGTTDYYVSQTVNGCESPRAIITVVVHPLPVAAFSVPQPISIENPTVHFTNQSIGATSWNWNFGDALSTASYNTSQLQSPNHTYFAAGTYCVNLNVSNGFCFDSIQICLIITPQFTFYIPNAFTPNGDGINDEFFGKGENITQFAMSIYDRWGNLLFYGDDIAKHWDGTFGGNIVQEDVYVYSVNIIDNLGQEHKYIGSVSVVK